MVVWILILELVIKSHNVWHASKKWNVILKLLLTILLWLFFWIFTLSMTFSSILHSLRKDSNICMYLFFSKKLADCAGHFGYIQLELPLFHAGYFRHTLTILQCICKRCSRILLPPVERQEFLKKMRNPKIDALVRSSIFKKIVDTCKHGSMCPYCRYPNGATFRLFALI